MLSQDEALNSNVAREIILPGCFDAFISGIKRQVNYFLIVTLQVSIINMVFISLVSTDQSGGLKLPES